MRGRLIAIVITLAVLAIAGTRYADYDQSTDLQSTAGASPFAEPPAPESDVPAIMTSEVRTSVRVTVLGVDSGRQLGPAFSVVTISRHSPVVAHSTGKPRFFPLLI